MSRLPTACPKPSPSEKSPRQTPKRKGWLQRGTKKIPKVNPARQIKRRDGYRKKLAAYRKSETYKIVEARADGRCEAIVQISAATAAEYNGVYRALRFRCPETREGLASGTDGNGPRLGRSRMTHHHKTYARFGGMEHPDDIILLCDRHNALEESKHPTRNRNYRSPD